MKTKKRFLGILLSLVMVFGLMPGMSATVYAETKDIAVGTVYSQGDMINFGDGADVKRGSYTNRINGSWNVM